MFMKLTASDHPICACASFRYALFATAPCRDGSRISGKNVHIYKGVRVRFADFVETKLFHFHRIFKNGIQGGGSSEPP